LPRPPRRTPKHHHTSQPVEEAALEAAGFDERLARAKALAVQVALLDTQGLEGSSDLGFGSKSYDHATPSTPSVSSLSDAPAKPAITQSLTEKPTRRKSPLHHMLEKMTIDFTDNLFFLHGVLRTYADTDAARASGEALDLAAGDVLQAIKTFSKRVELINEGGIAQPSLVKLRSAPAVHGNDLGASDITSEEEQREAGGVEDPMHEESEQERITAVAEAGWMKFRSPGTGDIEDAMLEDFPELRPQPARHDQGEVTGRSGAVAEEIAKSEVVPKGRTSFKAAYIDPFEELLRNPWSTETAEKDEQ